MAARALAATKAAGLKTNVVYVPHPSASPAQIAEAAETGAAAPLYTSDPAPFGLADYGLSNSNTEVYVANQASNTVSLISDTTNTLVATIPVGSSPTGVAYDSGTGDVYVANELSNNVSVISGTTVVTSVDVGTNPYFIAYDSGNGELYVTNDGSDTVSVINGGTNAVVATITVGNNPTDVVYDSGNGDVYVANLEFFGLAPGSVSVISDSTNTVVATLSIGTGSEPFGLAYDSGNGDVYDVNLAGGNVTVISGTTLGTSIPIPEPHPDSSNPRGIAYDGAVGELFVSAYGLGLIDVISDSTNSVVTNITVGSAPWGIALDSGSGDLYVANSGSANVSVINPSTDTVLASVPVGSSPVGVAYYPANTGKGLTPSMLTTTTVTGTADITSPGISGQDLYQNTPDAYSVQLNAVLPRVAILRNDSYTYWAQDIFTYYPLTGTVVLLTNVWNFTAPLASMNNGTIFQHGPDGTDQYPTLGFYFAEYTVPTALSYPIDVTLSMTSEIGSFSGFGGEEDTVFFSAFVNGSVPSLDIELPSYDYVAFNSLMSTVQVDEFGTPQFTVQPIFNPVGLLDDLEFVVGGPGGGSNVDLGSADATLGLDYWNEALGATSDIPSAYNYGSDTGETSMNANVNWLSDSATSPNGFADYATMTTGPSVMSGLWGTGAPSGADGLLFDVTPANAFIFVRYLGTAAWDQTIVNQASFVPSLEVSSFLLMPGQYQVSVALSDYENQASYITSPTLLVVTLSGPGTIVFTDQMQPFRAMGVVTPLWAFSNSQLAAISQSGAGTPANPYVLFNNPQLSTSGAALPLSSLFGLYNDYSFPVFPGVFLKGTTASVELNNSTEFDVENAGGPMGDAGAPATPYAYLPGLNDLQFWFWNVTGVALTNDTNLSGEFALSASLPLTYNSFSVIFYDSQDNLVANDTFATESQALLMYSGSLGVGGSNTVWGNRFIQIDPPTGACRTTGACYPLFPYNGGLGLEVGENGDLVYNNVFDTPTTAWLLPLNLYTGAQVTYTNDLWNVLSQPASNVAYASGFPGISLTGSIVGGATQGGNAWWDYGVTSNFANGADNPGTGPYLEAAPTLISGSSVFPCPTPYYCATYIGPVGDTDPLIPAGAAVQFTPTGIATGTVWGALVSCNVGGTQKNSGGGGTQKNSGGGGPPSTICCPGGTQKNSGGGGTQKNSGGGGPPGCSGPDPPPSVFADFETTHSVFDLVLPDGEFNWTPNAAPGYTSTTGAAFVVPPDAPTLPAVTVTVVYVGPSSGVATFTETGLLAGLTWSVTLAGATESLTTDGGADSLLFAESDGTYSYTVGLETGYVLNAPTNTGTVTVDNGPVTTPVQFALPTIFLSPIQGPLGSSVTVSGAGFTDSSSLTSLLFGGVAISTCTSGSLAVGATGSFQCTLVVPGGMTSSTVVATDVTGLTASATYTLTSLGLVVTPGQGPVGATVAIFGTGFSASTTLKSLVFDKVTISSCTAGSLVTSATGTFACTLLVPKGTSGTTVSATDVTSLTASGTFTVTKPSIAVTPGLGPVGATVTVSGSGFSVSAALKSLVFDGVVVSTCTGGSLTTGTAGIFACTFGVPAGTTSLTVEATDVGGQTASSLFLVTTPTVLVLPGQGPIGATVLAAGAGFSVSAPVGLLFDGVKVASCTSGSLTTSVLGLFACAFKVPSGTTSSTVTATDLGGQTSTSTFTVTTPKLTVSPSQGPVGATVTVSGSGFSILSTVGLKFDGVTLSTCRTGSLVSGLSGAFSCVLPVPKGTSSTTVTATDVGGQSASASFKVTTPAISLGTSQGAPGATVTVSGTGFSVSAKVAIEFDGISVTGCTSGSLTANGTGTFSCTFKVPSHTSGTSVTATDVGGQAAAGKYTVT